MALYLDGKKIFGDDVNAENISYDNTDSGLQATNVQEAIDEIDSIAKSTTNPLYHLGFYLDSNGGLCQVNEI